MILELPDVPIRKILLKLSLADFKSIQSVFVSTNSIYLKQLGFEYCSSCLCRKANCTSIVIRKKLSNLMYETVERRHIEKIRMVFLIVLTVQQRTVRCEPYMQWNVLTNQITTSQFKIMKANCSSSSIWFDEWFQDRISSLTLNKHSQRVVYPSNILWCFKINS